MMCEKPERRQPSNNKNGSVNRIIMRRKGLSEWRPSRVQIKAARQNSEVSGGEGWDEPLRKTPSKVQGSEWLPAGIETACRGTRTRTPYELLFRVH